MIRDAPTHGTTYECDVCIIGSGPAGMIVAAELSERAPGVRICVVESGRHSATPYADALRDLDCEGIPVEASTRERVFGGASSTWAGLSSPLHRIDFEHRPWVRYSGWPFGLDELMPWYARVARRYRFPDPELFDPETWCRRTPAGDFTPTWQRLTGTVLVAPHAPFRFGPELQTIFEQDRADLLLDATALRLAGERRTGRADCAIVRSSAGAEARVSAQLFVVACGGIENARLLLLSTYACATGLGNTTDQVGRHLMNHPKADCGCVLLNRRIRELPAYFGVTADEFFGSMGLRLAEAVQQETGVLNSYLRLRPVYDWSDVPAARAVLTRSSVRRTSDAWRGRHALWRHVTLHRHAEADAQVKTLRIRNFMEMEPDPANRVTLGRRRDAYGSPLPMVRHVVGSLDRATMQRLHE
jgi:choline dehydrogenase-like flavoprotein